jgi:hypothetical protein
MPIIYQCILLERLLAASCNPLDMVVAMMRMTQNKRKMTILLHTRAPQQWQ